ncbi:LLM class flavin-dependent oxidoreductase [Phyllobacterium phragmitis]
MPITFTGGPECWTTFYDGKSRSFAKQTSAAYGQKGGEWPGLDRIAIDGPPDLPDNHSRAAFALASRSGPGVLVSHCVGPLEPVIAARQLASLDQLGNGRMAIRIFPGGEPGPSANWEWLDHQKSIARADEYLVLLKRLWLNEKPFDHEGPYYSIRNGFCGVKPRQSPLIPLHMGGRSGLAVKLASKHADIFTLPPGTISETRSMMMRVREAAANFGRADKIGFSFPVMVVLGETRDEAWRRAERNPALPDRGRPEAMRLIGTPEEIARALLDYHALGIKEFVVHGLHAAKSLALFTHRLVPMVRRSAARARAGDHAGAIDAGVPAGPAGIAGWRGLRQKAWRT